MAALTKDRATSYTDGKIVGYPVAAGAKIYAGSMVCLNNSGYAVPAANAANYRFIGVAVRQVDNSSGANGDQTVEVFREGVFEFQATSIAQANVGADMYVVDDQTFDETDPGNGVKCGKLVKYISATKGWIAIGPALASVYTGSADALTVSDAGDHFAAAESTVAAQIQKLAKTIVVTLPRFTGWTKNGTAQAIALPLLEFPVPVMLKRAYLNLGTAPGSGKTLTIAVNGTTAVTISETNTQAESENLSIAVAANTDLAVTASETSGGSAANADLMLVYQVDDGE
jgi:hypothetical protein